MIVGSVLCGVTGIILFVIRRKPKSDSSQIAVNDFVMNSISSAITCSFRKRKPSIDTAPRLPAPQGPPLPEEGLPAGWTMEQWAWYGEDYRYTQQMINLRVQ